MKVQKSFQTQIPALLLNVMRLQNCGGWQGPLPHMNAFYKGWVKNAHACDRVCCCGIRCGVFVGRRCGKPVSSADWSSFLRPSGSDLQQLEGLNCHMSALHFAKAVSACRACWEMEELHCGVQRRPVRHAHTHTHSHTHWHRHRTSTET